MSDEDSEEYWDSGPFCRHWADPADCADLCKRCGHKCSQHAYGNDDGACFEDGCSCENWVCDTPADSAGKAS